MGSVVAAAAVGVSAYAFTSTGTPPTTVNQSSATKANTSYVFTNVRYTANVADASKVVAIDFNLNQDADVVKVQLSANGPMFSCEVGYDEGTGASAATAVTINNGVTWDDTGITPVAFDGDPAGSPADTDGYYSAGPQHAVCDLRKDAADKSSGAGTNSSTTFGGSVDGIGASEITNLSFFAYNNVNAS